jgi:hypothetical protein
MPHPARTINAPAPQALRHHIISHALAVSTHSRAAQDFPLGNRLPTCIARVR